MRWRHSVVIGFLGFLSLASWTGLRGAEAAKTQSVATEPKVGAMAPDFVLPDLNGTSVRLSDYRGKKVVLLTFWAPWCPACRFEMPTMLSVYQRFKDQGFELFAISIDQRGRQQTVDYAAAQRLPFPVLLDPEQEIMDRYRVTAIPTHVLIDRQGRMRNLHVGPKDWRQPASWRVLESVLKEP